MLITFFLGAKLWAGSLIAPLTAFAIATPACKEPNFLSFPTWYKYLKLNQAPNGSGGAACNPIITGLNDFWLIGLAGLEILLRIAVLVAIIYVMLGGIKYVTSRGNSEKTSQARTTTIDALVGLIIAIIATASVSFIAGRFVD